jgi:hypothetical protein
LNAETPGREGAKPHQLIRRRENQKTAQLIKYYLRPGDFALKYFLFDIQVDICLKI